MYQDNMMSFNFTVDILNSSALGEVNVSDYFNETLFNDFNLTCSADDKDVDCIKRASKLNYYIFAPLMIFICFVSLIINLKVLISIYWIRRPMSPTLQISLSLAGADAFSSFLLGTGIFLFSLLPLLISMPDLGCYSLAIEALRLSSIICSVFHLLALTGNHYLGILKPLHYASIMTNRNTRLIIAFLWLFPNVFYFVCFSLMPNEGFFHSCNFRFLTEMKFRRIYASMFFIPLILMVGIYSHIFVIVRKHQAIRSKFLKKGTQMSIRDETTLSSSCDDHIEPHRRYRSERARKKEEQNMNRNIKAIRTTLYILGSYFVGLMPNTVVYCLICYDCMYDIRQINQDIMFYVFVLFNTLCIMKTLVNPIIYAARMQEIKNATTRMNDAFDYYVCGLLRQGRRQSNGSMNGNGSTHYHHRNRSTCSRYPSTSHTTKLSSVRVAGSAGFPTSPANAMLITEIPLLSRSRPTSGRCPGTANNCLKPPPPPPPPGTTLSANRVTRTTNGANNAIGPGNEACFNNVTTSLIANNKQLDTLL